ncbi:MAG: aminotransferase class I/II-fold pyridoxal phosphate-dependent enzyme [Proteobacteria bacterium]|nr:aminotransferase class I/II-fold pyridoxal phosphate-dependent enzyme [Pseudomonadota bacterium]
MLDNLNSEILLFKETPIMEIANFGRNYEKEIGKKVLPAWFGEGDSPTSSLIYNETIEALKNGKSFYTFQNGIYNLRTEIAKYMNEVFDITTKPENHSVVTGGMMGLRLICDLIVDHGDEVVMVGPVWPNIRSSVLLKKGNIKEISLKLNDGEWVLDYDYLINSITKNTKMVFVNSPGNPTGWVMPKKEQERLLEHTRNLGCWLISDEVYHQITYNDLPSPSFLQSSKADDRLIVINSASKSFSMTGWRIGWITHPEELGVHIAKLVQITTTGVPEFLQYGLISALKNYKEITKELRKNLKASRDIMFDRLIHWKKVDCSIPDAAFYAFFKVKGVNNSLDFAKKLILETNVGVAPGIAFGQSGEGHIRICFAAKESFINKIMDRLEPILS